VTQAQLQAISAENAAASTRALTKLSLFAVGMALLPLTSYFVSLKYLFENNTTIAAISAVVVANVVLVGFIVVAIREEQEDGKMVVGEDKRR